MNSDIIYESILLRTIIILAMMLFAFYLSLTLGRWTRRMRKISRSVILGVYFAAVSIAIAGTEIIVVKGRGNIPYEVMPLLLIAAIAAIVYILGKIGFRIGERNKNGNEELKRKYSEIQTAYDKLTIAEEEFEALFNAGNEAMWRADPVDHKVRYSDRVLEMFGYAPSEMEEYLKSRQGRIHPEDAAMVAQNEKDLIAAIINSFTIEYRVRHKEGRYLWVRNKATRLKYSNGSIMGVIGSVADVTKEKEYEGKILDMAYRDGLTGLPNRSAFAERFEEELRESTERTGRGVLLFVDTDNFKYINDVLGHNAGDMMLREIGQRLAMLQEKDRTFICRVGGDEFVIVFYGLTETEAIVRKTKEIMEAFEKPFDINGKKLNLTISVGITRYPEDGSTVEKLLKNADIAMYKAKEKGKDCFCFFEASMEEAAARRANMENHLRKAVDNGEMLLYYQPQINIMENRLIGFEALVRWNSPIFGMVSPAQFIPIAEDTGIIINLGKWILKNACDFARELNRRRPGEPKFISVNISPLQINNSDFTGIIQRIIEDSDIEPGMLGIEITETALLESFDTVAGKIETLGKMGIKISLDDFGMGFSSLNHLRTLSIDTVKIDKSFIDDIVKDDKSYIMTEAIINLSHKLGVQIVAEGVEESEQVEILKEYGCDAIQGYFFSRPIPEREAIEFMKNDKGTGVLS